MPVSVLLIHVRRHDIVNPKNLCFKYVSSYDLKPMPYEGTPSPILGTFCLSLLVMASQETSSHSSS